MAEMTIARSSKLRNQCGMAQLKRIESPGLSRNSRSPIDLTEQGGRHARARGEILDTQAAHRARAAPVAVIRADHTGYRHILKQDHWAAQRSPRVSNQQIKCSTASQDWCGAVEASLSSRAMAVPSRRRTRGSAL